MTSPLRIDTTSAASRASPTSTTSRTAVPLRPSTSTSGPFTRTTCPFRGVTPITLRHWCPWHRARDRRAPRAYNGPRSARLGADVQAARTQRRTMAGSPDTTPRQYRQPIGEQTDGGVAAFLQFSSSIAPFRSESNAVRRARRTRACASARARRRSASAACWWPPLPPPAPVPASRPPGHAPRQRCGERPPHRHRPSAQPPDAPAPGALPPRVAATPTYRWRGIWS